MELVVYEKTIKVVGIKYDNRESTLKEIIAKGVQHKKLSPYLNVNVGRMLQNNVHQLGEYDEQRLESIKLEEDKFQGKPSLKVLLSNYEGSYEEIGFIPQSEIKQLKKYLKYKVQIDPYIIGGTFRVVENNSISEHTLSYGVKLHIKITK